MDIKLTLVSAPVSSSQRYGEFSRAGSTEPSFGLACLASYAVARGAQVSIVEASSLGLTVEQTLARVEATTPDVVGISAATVGICAAGELAERLKAGAASPVVLVGGSHATALPQETLEEFKGIDLAVIGEGERTLGEILEKVGESRVIPIGIAGTAERNETGTKINPPRALLETLDDLPLPAWSLLDGFPRAFHPSPARARRSPCATVVLTRGCPNQCTFCDRSVFGNRCRSYSPEYCLRLFRDLRDNYGVREVLVEDDTFVVSRARVREFCELLIENRINMSWSCLGRADRVDRDLLVLMKKAGCWHISYGIESGDPEILGLVGKKMNVEQMRQAVQWSREVGLYTKGFFILGLPKETPETLEKTRKFALSLKLDDITVMHLTPFPGSALYDTAAQYGTVDRDWGRMNTLETVFVPNGLSEEQLDEARRKMLRSFYMRPSVVGRHMARLIKNPATAGSVLRGACTFLQVTRNR